MSFLSDLGSIAKEFMDVRDEITHTVTDAATQAIAHVTEAKDDVAVVYNQRLTMWRRFVMMSPRALLASKIPLLPAPNRRFMTSRPATRQRTARKLSLYDRCHICYTVNQYYIIYRNAMKAVVRVGGKQYIVAAKETLLDLLPEGTKELTLEPLMIFDDKDVQPSAPQVSGIKIKGKGRGRRSQR